MKYWDAFRLSDTIVVPVNTKGIMGAGLAKALKPYLSQKDLEYYRDLCKEAKGGDAYYGLNNRWLFAFTKENWKDKSRLDWVESILQHMILLSSEKATLLLPHLGCGLGGLDYETQVKPLYDHYLKLMSWKKVYVL